MLVLDRLECVVQFINAEPYEGLQQQALQLVMEAIGQYWNAPWHWVALSGLNTQISLVRVYQLGHLIEWLCIWLKPPQPRAAPGVLNRFRFKRL
jgi:hypothetical protein